MEIRFVRAVQFTSLLKAGGRLREFNFRKINNEQNPELFSVNVCDDRGERVFFTMQKEQNDWRFGPKPIPVWIGQLETQLHAAIEEELQNPLPDRY